MAQQLCEPCESVSTTHPGDPVHLPSQIDLQTFTVNRLLIIPLTHSATSGERYTLGKTSSPLHFFLCIVPMNTSFGVHFIEIGRIRKRGF